MWTNVSNITITTCIPSPFLTFWHVKWPCRTPVLNKSYIHCVKEVEEVERRQHRVHRHAVNKHHSLILQQYDHSKCEGEYSTSENQRQHTTKDLTSMVITFIKTELNLPFFCWNYTSSGGVGVGDTKTIKSKGFNDAADQVLHLSLWFISHNVCIYSTCF